MVEDSGGAWAGTERLLRGKMSEQYYCSVQSRYLQHYLSRAAVFVIQPHSSSAALRRGPRPVLTRLPEKTSVVHDVSM